MLPSRMSTNTGSTPIRVVDSAHFETIVLAIIAIRGFRDASLGSLHALSITLHSRAVSVYSPLVADDRQGAARDQCSVLDAWHRGPIHVPLACFSNTLIFPAMMLAKCHSLHWH